MKSIIKSLVLSIIAIALFYNVGQAENKTSEVKIKTSAVCDMCKTRIEKGLGKVAGVTKSDLDVDTKYVTVNYDPAKITPDEIKTSITKLGYDADDKPASKTAYDKLPKCCKKGGHS
jgi:mercuric ion binding protein